jgi:hypothetical protein
LRHIFSPEIEASAVLQLRNATLKHDSNIRSYISKIANLSSQRLSSMRGNGGGGELLSTASRHWPSD